MTKSFTLVMFITAVLVGCQSSKKTTAVQDNCKNLPKLRWQNESLIKVDSNFLKLTTDLVAAAKYDVSVSKRISDSIGVKFESQLSKRLSTIADSKVSQEFWEADIAFRQVICLLDNKISDKNTSLQLKEALQKQYIETIEAQRLYLNELQKKTSLIKKN